MEFKLEDMYIKFVLLDLMAKIAPGAFCIISIFLALGNSLGRIGFDDFYSIIDKFKTITVWVWIIFIAFSWIVGFAIQGLGERFGVIKYGLDKPKDELLEYAKDAKDFDKKTAIFEKMTIEFNEFANDGEKIRYQRIVAIKEACGNGCVALFFSFFILLVSDVKFRFLHILKDPYTSILLVFIYIILIGSLWYMHSIHRNRQDDYYHLVKTDAESRACGYCPSNKYSR